MALKKTEVDFVTSKEVADLLGISDRTFRRYKARDQLPKRINLPGPHRWLKSDILAVLRKAGAL